MNKFTSFKNLLQSRSAGRVMLVSLGLMLMVVLLGFARHEEKGSICQGVDIQIEPALAPAAFLTNSEVENIITAVGRRPLHGQPLNSIQLSDIESDLLANAFVSEAHAHTDFRGKIQVELTLRNPIIRIALPGNGGYYLDENGIEMPLSTHFTAHVPVAIPERPGRMLKNDSLKSSFNASLFALAEYLRKDNFASSLTGEIRVGPSHEIHIYPRLGSCTLHLGDTSDLAGKFLKLKHFYQKSLPAEGWDTYSSVSVKYRNQIIANRR